MKEKFIELEKIYSSFTKKAREYKDSQACQKGCAFCCSEAGSIRYHNPGRIADKKGFKCTCQKTTEILHQNASPGDEKKRKKKNCSLSILNEKQGLYNLPCQALFLQTDLFQPYLHQSKAPKSQSPCHGHCKKIHSGIATA